MATLELTDEEKEADTYFHWSDEALGKAVRASAHKIRNGEIGTGHYPIIFNAGLIVLSAAMRRTNVEEVAQEFDRFESEGEVLGDFRLTIERIDEPDDADETS